MNPRSDRSAQIFAALGDATRREVIRHLSGQAMTATELTEHVPVTRQAIAKHLAALEEAGLVSSVRHGRENRYRLTPAPLNDAVSWMTSVGAEWDERLARLHKRVDRRR